MITQLSIFRLDLMSKDAIRDRFRTSIAEIAVYLISSSFDHEKFLLVIAAIFL